MRFARRTGMGDGAFVRRADILGVPPQGSGLIIMLARLPRQTAFVQHGLVDQKVTSLCT